MRRSRIRKNASLQTVARAAVARSNRAAREWSRALADQREASARGEHDARMVGGWHDRRIGVAWDRWMSLADIAWHLARLAGVAGPLDSDGRTPWTPDGCEPLPTPATAGAEA